MFLLSGGRAEIDPVERNRYTQRVRRREYVPEETYLDVIASVVIATFSEQSMSHYFVHVQFVQDWIRILL